MGFVLKPYQSQALEAVAKREHARGIVAMATGTGKTVVASHLPSVLGDVPTLFLAHREELIEQMAATVSRVEGHVVGIERAQHRAEPMAKHVVASIPTLAARDGKRMRGLGTDRFGLIVVDEVHHGTAESYLRTFEHFGLLERGLKVIDGKQRETWLKTPMPRVPLIGLTATPGRGDGVGLHNIVDGITFQYGLKQAIADGWLVPIRAFTVTTDVVLDDVRTRAGDYAEKDLANAVATDARNATIFDAHSKHAQGLKTLVFCVDVAHAEQVAEHFASRGVEARSISGRMDGDERRSTFAWFHATPGAVLTNCAIVTEGVDIPSVECVVTARPTKSATLFAQMIGRGTRLAAGCYDYDASVRAGKSHMLLLDITDSTSRVGARAVNVMDIVGAPLPLKPLDGEDVFQAAEQQALDLEAQEAQRARSKSVAVDLFGTPEPLPPGCTLRWISLGGSLRLPMLDKSALRVQSNILDQWIIERYNPVSRLWVTAADAEDHQIEAIRVAEKLALKSDPAARAILSADARWHADAPSEKQLAACARMGIAVPKGATKGQVSAAMDRAFGRRTG